MKMTKNTLKLCCILVFAVLIVIQAVTINRLNDLTENRMQIVQGASGNNQADPSIQTSALQETPMSEPTATEIPVQKTIIVLDPGHGKSSGAMTDEEKMEAGFVQNSSGSWGDWRHWKTGTIWNDCEGSGCNGRAPENGGCWYPIESGDRDTEPEINLANALAAKARLEQLGYDVRMTRTTNDENPSLTKRLKKCYPNDDTSQAPDAAVYVCIHSNAGGGNGSAYLALSSGYDHLTSTGNYAEEGNRLGSLINDQILAQTSLTAYSGGCYTGQPDLVLFHKCPVPIGYMEIGFFDNSSDLAILQSESGDIGTAIADGIDAYIKQKG